MGEAVELLRMLVEMDGAQPAGHETVSISLIDVPVPHSSAEIRIRAADDFDAVLEWALASIIEQ